MRRILLLLSLFVGVSAGTANAAVVARFADDAALALTPGGAPRVGYVDGHHLFLAWRRNDGRWLRTLIGRLPAGKPRVAGVAIDPGGRAFVLVQDEEGRWLRLAHRPNRLWRIRTVTEDLPPDAVLGHAGLTLDRTGRPAVAYAYRLPDRKTFLRLVAGGTFRTIPITREGFPESATVPAAAPVRMPDGTIRVLETYSARGGGAILWRYAGNDWRGLFLSSSVGGTSPVGPAFARAGTEGFAAAWTLAGPTPGELQVRVAPRPDRPQSDVLHRRALVEALALTQQGAEVAATESVSGLTAGLLIAPGGVSEFDGRLLGLEAAGFARHVLLSRRDGLHLYGPVVLQPISVSLAAAPIDAGVRLSGSVAGATSRTVTLWRERPESPLREFLGRVAIAVDGSFALEVPPAVGPAFYRAVSLGPQGLPHAALLRTPVG
jgi:hypothetical protein